jgi:hypothetical protein
MASKVFIGGITGLKDMWCIIDKNGNFLTKKTISSALVFSDNVNFAYTYSEEEAKAMAKGLSNSPLYKEHTPIKAKPFKDYYNFG